MQINQPKLCINEEILKDLRGEYGKQIVELLAQDLTTEYGKGLSKRHLHHYLRFANTYPDI